MFEGPLQDVIDEFSRLPGIGPKSAQRIALHLLTIEQEELERFQSALGRLQAGVAFCRICHNISQEDVCRICADSGRNPALVCVVEESKDIQVIERTAEFRGRYHVLGGALDPLGGIGPKELNIASLLQRIGGTMNDVLLSVPGQDTGVQDMGNQDADVQGGGVYADMAQDAGAQTDTAQDTAPQDMEQGSPARDAGVQRNTAQNTALQGAPVYAEAPVIEEIIIATDPNTEGEATASYLARLLKDFPGLTVSRLASGIPMGGDLEFVDDLTLSRAFAARTVLTAS